MPPSVRNTRFIALPLCASALTYGSGENAVAVRTAGRLSSHQPQLVEILDLLPERLRIASRPPVEDGRVSGRATDVPGGECGDDEEVSDRIGAAPSSALDRDGELSAPDPENRAAGAGRYTAVSKLNLRSSGQIDPTDVDHRRRCGAASLAISTGPDIDISDNVHRGINFRFHAPTADALRSLMVSAGVSTVLEPEKVVSGATLGAQ